MNPRPRLYATGRGRASTHRREVDEALEATEALHELRDAEAEAGAAGAEADGEGLSMMMVGIIALIGLVAAIAPAVVAATAAFGAFALFAYPAVKQVTGALGDTKGQLALLPAPIRLVVTEVKNLEGEWKKLSAQFTLPVARLMSQGLGILTSLLPRLIPLAQDGAKAAGQLMDALGKGLDSKGFSDFLSMMEQFSGPATSALIGLAGTIGGILVDALEQLAPYAVPMIKMLQDLLKASGPALVGALKFIAQALMDIGGFLTPLMGPLGKLIGFMDQHPIFAQMAAALLGVAVAMKAVAAAQAILAAVSDLDPWMLVLIALAVIGLEIYDHWHEIAHLFDIVRHSVAEAGHEIAQAFDTVRHSAATLAHDTAAHFDEIRHDIAQWAGDVHHDADMVVDFFRELPGRILAELQRLPGQMLTFGLHVVEGLWNGLKAEAAPVLNWVRGLAGDISGAFSSALSILSPARVFYQHGVNTLQGYIDGWKSKAPELLALVHGSGGSVGGAGAGLLGGGGGYGGSGGASHAMVNITAQFNPSTQGYASPAFYQYLQREIQEAVARWSLNNPGTGFGLPGRA